MPTTDERLERLTARVDALEDALAKGRAARSMRASGRCPSCGGGRLLHAERIADRANRPDMPAMALAVPREGFLQRERPVGELSALLCTECGLMEWFVSEPDELEALLEQEGFELRYQEEPERGPFR